MPTFIIANAYSNTNIQNVVSIGNNIKTPITLMYAVESSNLVSNSEFEIDTGSWTPIGPATLSRTGSFSFNGNFSLLTERNGTGDARIARWTMTGSAAAIAAQLSGSVCKIRARIKANTSASLHAAQRMHLYAESDGLDYPFLDFFSYPRTVWNSERLLTSGTSTWLLLETAAFLVRNPSYFYINFDTQLTDASATGDGIYIDSVELRRYI